MLLSLLDKKEKLKFLDLVVHMIDMDDTSAVEKRLLDIFIAEIGVDIAKEYSFDNGEGVSETRSFFKNSNSIVRKICLYNLMKVTLVDDLYNTKEHEFVEQTRNEFEISEEVKKDLFELIYEESDLREKIRRTISK